MWSLDEYLILPNTSSNSLIDTHDIDFITTEEHLHLTLQDQLKLTKDNTWSKSIK